MECEGTEILWMQLAPGHFLRVDPGPVFAP